MPGKSHTQTSESAAAALQITHSFSMKKIWVIFSFKTGKILLEFSKKKKMLLLLLLLAWRFFQTWAYSASTSMRCTNSPAEQMTSPLLVSSGTWRYPGKKRKWVLALSDKRGQKHFIYCITQEQTKKTEFMWFTKSCQQLLSHESFILK